MKYILTILLLVVTSVAESATCSSCTQILCVADKSTGFLYRNGTWNTTEFKTDSKFIITTASPNNSPLEGVIAEWFGGVYRVISLGDEWGSGYCNPVDEEEGQFECRERFSMWDRAHSEHRQMLGRIFFSLKHLEYLRVYPYGGWSDVDLAAKYPDRDFSKLSLNKKSTPFIEIGRCAPL